MEVFEHESVSLYLSDLSLIEDIVSKVQHIQIYRHSTLGMVLVINGEINNVEKWAPLYHEAIVHVPMMFIEQPKTVLILGGGDLYAAELVLNYSSVTRVILCDYDPEIVRLTSQYYSHAKSTLADSRLTILYQDARVYLDSCHEQFDLIIDDCFNLVEDFSSDVHIFKKLYNYLTPNVGVCSSLIYRHIFDKQTMQKNQISLFNQFNTAQSMVVVPEYPGVLHLLTMWGESKFLSQNLESSQNEWHIAMTEQEKSCGQLFDPKFCKYYLYLPPYIKNQLKECEGIVEKDV